MKLFLEVDDATKKHGLAHYGGVVHYLDANPTKLMENFNTYKNQPENNFVNIANMFHDIVKTDYKFVYMIPSEEESSFPLMLSRLYEAQVGGEKIKAIFVGLYTMNKNLKVENIFGADASLEFDATLVTITTFTAYNRKRHLISFQSKTAFSDSF